jgi:crossover junction endodeoxyribonuclease RuvC
MALYETTLDQLLAVYDFPTVEIRVGRSKARRVYQDAALASLIREIAPDVVVIELVGGITGQSASASFNFGAGVGLLRGISATLQVPVEHIHPAVWRSRLHVPKGKDGSRHRAGQLFPKHAHLFQRAKDDGRAESALIALAYATHTPT